MNTMGRTTFHRRILVAVTLVVALGLVFAGHGSAGPVIQSAQGTAPGEPNYDYGAPGYSLTTQTPNTGTTSTPSTSETTPSDQTTTAPPSSSPRTSPTTNTQQTPTYQPTNTQTLPLPPTYAPGSPAAAANPNANPYGAMPMAPTAYGLWNSQTPAMNTQTPGSYGQAMGYGSGYGGTMPSGMGGGAEYGLPPAPTQTSSLGNATMADPSFGRFEAQPLREATAPRQPAVIGRNESQILRGDKPFSAYRPASAYSPYMRLSQNSGNPSTNNYYEWVKPLLEQEQENRQVAYNIQGLSNTTRTGYQTMESLKQRPGNIIYGTAPRTPATFMNTGQYYPGFGR